VSTDRLFALVIETGLAPAPPWLNAWVDGSPRPQPAGAFDAIVAARPNVAAPVDVHRRARVAAWLVGPAIGEAWRDMTARFGPDARAWEWGRMHRVSFVHPLASSPALQAVLNTGDVPRGGDATTPNATGAGSRQTAGASYREVLDVSNWDRSVTINVPGISGQPGSPHYADLLPLWAEGRYHPLPFSREAVDRAASERLRLVPANSRQLP
jgi:acyl-homoserine lactone acylase PvdQ